MYFYVITFVVRFYGIVLSASLNNGPFPLQLGPLTFGAVRTYYMQNIRVLSYYCECDVRVEDIAATKFQAISRFFKAVMGAPRSHYNLECWNSGP